jgi:flagellar hook-basal body complex protein FliE
MQAISSLTDVLVVDNPFNLESTSQVNNTEKTKVSSEFTNILLETINSVNNSQIEADNQITAFIRGDEGISMHNVILSAQEAQLSMQMLIEIRNSLYDCYKELNNVTM